MAIDVVYRFVGRDSKCCWFVVDFSGMMCHVAFRIMHGIARWLDSDIRRGLSGSLPVHFLSVPGHNPEFAS